MSRISKAPEERRLEFIETAERLFFERGFDETAVSDIVKELKVAQGTFYCYFKSKEDVLAAVIQANITETMDRLQARNNEPCKNATERLTRIVNTSLADYSTNSKMITYVQKESNSGIHQKILKQIIAHIAPMLEQVMREGIHSGEFEVQHPEEMAGALMGIIMHIFHDLDFIHKPKRRQRMRATLEQIFTRSLCAKEGSLHFKW